MKAFCSWVDNVSYIIIWFILFQYLKFLATKIALKRAKALFFVFFFNKNKKKTKITGDKIVSKAFNNFLCI